MQNKIGEETDFATSRGYWFGWAVSRRRKAVGLTASELARRTVELDYPITRSTIAKIESNLRSGKMDVAEVLVLAAALDVPPMLLIFPQYATDADTLVLPDYRATEDEAVRWMSGQSPLPQQRNMDTEEPIGVPNQPNSGVELIQTQALLEEALDQRASLLHHERNVKVHGGDDDSINLLLEKNSHRIAMLRIKKQNAISRLWGFGSDFQDEETSGEGDATDG